MSTDTGTTLTMTKGIAATPERVFEAWTTPDQMKVWACPEYATLENVEIDLRVGGGYLLDMKTDEGPRYTAFGTYREIDAPNRIVYTWDWKQEEHAVGETLVTVEFNAVGDATEILLTHDLFPSVEAKAGHEEGWGSCLTKLERHFV